jgi:ubiquinone/menaquinone biosynthesis C-methylase UbiE
MSKTATMVPGGNELLDPYLILKNELEVKPASRIGDFGCGNTGCFSFQASKLVGNDGEVYAIDILQEVLQNIESRKKQFDYKNVKVIKSNIEKFGATKINNDYLDFALIINVLFQIKKQEDFLKEVTRTVKSGGKILVIDWEEGRFSIGPEAKNKIKSQDIVKKATEKANLKLIKRFSAGDYHFGIIFEKE